jgi:RNA polymerase sigma-70 factor (sigma-E family)
MSKMRDEESSEIDEFLGAHSNALQRLAFLLMHDSHRAEDLVQDVFVQVIRTWPRASEARNPSAYLRRVLINSAASWRRRMLNSEVPCREFIERTDESSVVEGYAERDMLWQLLARLTVRQRAVLILRYYEDLDDSAIGNIIEAPAATVRSLIARGLGRLRSFPELEEYFSTGRTIDNIPGEHHGPA